MLNVFESDNLYAEWTFYCYADYRYAKCLYTRCHYAEHHYTEFYYVNNNIIILSSLY
jgi:hypothetical protein